MTGAKTRTQEDLLHHLPLPLSQEGLEGGTEDSKSKTASNTRADEGWFSAYHSSAKDTSGCSKSCRPGDQGERVNE